MCIAFHPYVMGRPHRAKYLAEVLDYVMSHDRVWQATTDEIAEYYLAHYYDAAVAHAARRSMAAVSAIMTARPRTTRFPNCAAAWTTTTTTGRRSTRRARRSSGRETPASRCARSSALEHAEWRRPEGHYQVRQSRRRLRLGPVPRRDGVVASRVREPRRHLPRARRAARSTASRPPSRWTRSPPSTIPSWCGTAASAAASSSRTASRRTA